MSSEIGKKIRMNIFGESHGKGIGVVIDNLPAGEAIDLEELYKFIDRRKPGKNKHSTARNESDKPTFISGFFNGVTTGSPLCALIENQDNRSGDYSELENKPRPAHADFTAFEKYSGFADMRGGGHFSGRLTAPMCVAGGIAKQILSRKGIEVGCHVWAIGNVSDLDFDSETLNKNFFEKLSESYPPVIDKNSGNSMLELIEKTASENNSIGGIVECGVIGLDSGFGSPIFGGIESRLAEALFGIPAVRGVEFGSGFNSAKMLGSENNDEFFINHNGKISTKTNHHGGILGGITTGQPIILRVAFKPTPSISRPQQTIDMMSLEPTAISIKGRHDPCIVIRAVPVVEALTAITLLDIILND